MAQYKCTTCGLVETLKRMVPDCCSACGSSVFDLTRAAAIAAKNDAFRRNIITGKTKGVPKGRAVATRAIAAEGEAFQRLALMAVATQTTFSEDEDPHAEHDFGKITVAGKVVWWKIDLYDERYEYGTENPLDDNKTRRVLTVLFPSDY